MEEFTFNTLSKDDPRAIEKYNHLVNKELQTVQWIEGPFAKDFWTGRRKKPKAAKCTCTNCGNVHTQKGAH